MLENDGGHTQSNMNEYFCFFKLSVFCAAGDAVECNTRPKATLRSFICIFLLFFFFFKSLGTSRKRFCPVGPQANPYACACVDIGAACVCV